jgi:hypothetical protein
MCYSNPTIVNMYWYYRKLVYKIIVNGGGYRITYFVADYWIYSPSLSLYIYYPVASYKISIECVIVFIHPVGNLWVLLWIWLLLLFLGDFGNLSSITIWTYSIWTKQALGSPFVLSTTPQDHLIIWYETIPSIDCACHPNLLFYNSIIFLDIPSIIETCLHYKIFIQIIWR